MSDMTILKVENNDALNITVNIYGTKEDPMFNAGEVAMLLWTPKTDRAIPRPRMEKLNKALTIGTANGPSLLPDSYITEKQYYKAILKSNSKVAEPFYDWLSDDVLPALRKDGVYITDTKIEDAIAEFAKIVSKKGKQKKSKLDAIFDIYGDEKVIIATESVLKTITKSTANKEIIYKVLVKYITGRRLSNAAELLKNPMLNILYSHSITKVVRALSAQRKHMLSRTKTKLAKVIVEVTDLKARKIPVTDLGKVEGKEEELREEIERLQTENAGLKEFDQRSVKFFMSKGNPIKTISKILAQIKEAGHTLVFAGIMKLNEAHGKDTDEGRNYRPQLRGTCVTVTGEKIEGAVWHRDGDKKVSISRIGYHGGYSIITTIYAGADENNVGHYIGGNGGMDFFATYEEESNILIVYKENENGISA